MNFERFSVEALNLTSPPAPPPPPIVPGDERIAYVRNAVEGMEQSRRHHAIPKQQWYVLLRDLRSFTDQWLDIALGCDWPLIDLYGSPVPVTGRIGLMGVVLLLKGRPIESIDRSQIVIANRDGVPNIWRRGINGTAAPHGMQGSILIWNAIRESY